MACAEFALSTKKFKAILCDVNGVLFDSDCAGGGKPIPNSVDAVNRLYEKGIPVRFVTNESQHGAEELLRKLENLGYSIPLEHIHSPLNSLRGFLSQRPHLKPYLLLHKNVLSTLHDIPRYTADECNSVVLGDAAEGFTFQALNTAFQILMNTEEKSTPLITLGTGVYYKQGSDLQLDVGAFTAALQVASGKSATVIGKPSREFFLNAVQSMRVQPHEVMMVGDDIVVDIAGAQDAGIFGVLVRSGKYRQSRDEPHETVKPSAYVNNLWDAVVSLTG